MNRSKIEFIRTNDVVSVGNEIVVKNEESLEEGEPEVNILEGSDSISKCGEIFTFRGGSLVLICEFCNAQFDNMLTFGKHLRDTHQDKVQVTADTLLGSPPINLLEEIDAITSGSKVEPDSSDESMNGQRSESSWDGSSNVEDDEVAKRQTQEVSTIISCDLCDRKYKNKRTLLRHQRKSGCKQTQPPGDPTLFCIPCGRQLKTKKTFQRHLRSHDRKHQAADDDDLPKKAEAPVNPTLFCEHCNRYFKSKHNLRYHATKTHEHDQIPLALQRDLEFLNCRFCNRACSDIVERKQHESTHTATRPYQCPHCDKSFETNYKRSYHMRAHSGERYPCPHCSNTYMHKTELSRHIKRHLNQREFPCEICSKRFFRKTERAIHMRTHTGERPYVCEDCGNSFVVLGQLREHQKRHTQTKNFKCEICGRLFYSNSILKDHQAAHSDEKPFGCEICGRKFPRIKALKKHMKLHSDVKEYSCDICGKEYAQNSGLYAHKKSHGFQK